MGKKYVLDYLAAWLGVCCDDWDADFDDDGYTDFWGREPLNEPLVWEDVPKEEKVSSHVTIASA